MRSRQAFSLGLLLVACADGPPLAEQAAALEGCQSAVLDGVLALPQDKRIDAVRKIGRPMTTFVPPALDVVAGNAGQGTAKLFARLGGQDVMVCTYRGAATVAHPTNAQAPGDGLAYLLDRCTAGGQVGSPITADEFVLRVVSGDSQGATIVAHVTLDELGPNCAPPGTLDVPPSTYDSTVPTTFFNLTRHLWEGENAPQRGSRQGIFEPDRVAAVRGQFVDRAGQPIVQAAVSVVGRPEYGITFTRRDGYFDFVLNGGESNVLKIAAQGKLTLYKNVGPAKGVWERLGDARLPYFIGTDPSSLRYDVYSGLKRPQIVQGDLANQNLLLAGDIAITKGEKAKNFLYLPPDTQVFVDGALVPSASLAVTTYSVGPKGPGAMPGTLPPSTMYTHAVSIAGLAGAHVEFKKADGTPQSASYYVSNFLGFDTSTANGAGSIPEVKGDPPLLIPSLIHSRTPAAYLDPLKGWIASQSGRVLAFKLGGADELTDLAPDDDFPFPPEERNVAHKQFKELSFWRVPMAHLSDWDANLGVFPPNGAGHSKGAIAALDTTPCPKKAPGSIIECDNQGLGESIPVAGTPYSLEYRSTHSLGYEAERTLRIPLGAVPSVAASVEVSASVDGAAPVTSTFAPGAIAPAEWVFKWDGKLSDGKVRQGPARALVKIDYVFQATPLGTGTFGYNGGGVVRNPDGSVQWISVEKLNPHPVFTKDGVKIVFDVFVHFTRQYYATIGGFDWEPEGFHHLRLNVHHAYAEGVVYKGDGSRLEAGAFTNLAAKDLTPLRSGCSDSSTPSIASGVAPRSIDGATIFYGIVGCGTDAQLRWLPKGGGTPQVIPFLLATATTPATIKGEPLIALTSRGDLVVAAKLDSLEGDAALYVARYQPGPGADPSGYLPFQQWAKFGAEPRAAEGVSVGPSASTKSIPGKPAALAVTDNVALVSVLIDGGSDPRGVVYSVGLVDPTLGAPGDTLVRRVAGRPPGWTTSSISAVPVAAPGDAPWSIATDKDFRHVIKAIAPAKRGDGLVEHVFLGTTGAIYRLDVATGLIQRIAGKGTTDDAAEACHPGDAPDSGDGGPALDAHLEIGCDAPGTTAELTRYGLAADLYGAVYVVADDSHPTVGKRLRRISRDGRISTVGGKLGVGENAAATGKPITDVPLLGIRQMEFGADEALYVADLAFGVRRFSVVLDTPAGATATPVGADPTCSGAMVFVPDPGAGTIYEFNADGLHCATLDRFGTPLLVFAYAGTPKRLAKVTDLLGHETIIDRDAAGMALQIKAPFEQLTSLTRSGDVLTITNPAFESHVLTFDALGLLKTFQTPRKKLHTFEYELPTATTPGGRLSKDTLPGGLGVTTLVRDTSATSWSVTMTDLEGGKLTRTNERGLDLVTRTETGTDGVTTSSVQQLDGTTTLLTPAEGTDLGGPVVTTMHTVSDPDFGIHSSLANTSVAIPARTGTLSWPAVTASAETTFERTLGIEGAPLSLTQAVTTTVFSGTGGDAAAAPGRVTTTVKKLGPTFAPAVFEITTETGEGRKTIAYLDKLQRPIRRTVPEGTLLDLTTSYDDDSVATGGTSTRFPRTIAQGTRKLGFFYDGATGFLKRVDAPEAMSTSFGVVDAVGRVWEATYPGGQLVKTGYDPSGNLTSITPPGRTTAHGFVFDDADRGKTYDAPAVPGVTSTQSKLGLYLDGLPHLATTPTATLTFIRDSGSRSRIVQIQDGSTPSETVTIGYGILSGMVEGLSKASPTRGLLISWQGPLVRSIESSGLIEARVAFKYDARFRPVSETVTSTGFAYSESPLVLAYDTDGVPTKVGAMTYAFESANPKRFNGSSLDGVLIDSFTRSGFGELSTWTATWSGGGFSYDLEATPRDGLGRITGKTETVDGVTTAYAYKYDSAGRLWQVYQGGSFSGGSLVGGSLMATYLYGPNNNRISKATPSGTVSVDGALDIDAQDRPKKWGDLSFAYSDSGELVTASTTAGDVTRYAYSGSSTLMSATLHAGSTTEKKVEYVLDAAGNPAVRKVNGVETDRYFWIGGRIVLHKSASGVVTRMVYGSRVNVPDYVVRGGKNFRVVVDHLGSVRAVVPTEAPQVPVQKMKFDEFGIELTETASAFGGVPLPFGYAGGFYDRDTKLVRFGARWYDPQTGRWITKDPGGLGGGLNLYQYGRSNPLYYVDVTGRGPVAFWVLLGTSVVVYLGANVPSDTHPAIFPSLLNVALIFAAPAAAAEELLAAQAAKKVAIAEFFTESAAASEANNSLTCGGGLTNAEHSALQGVANDFETELYVYGSRANGKARNVGTNLPPGKGPGTRSDIDVRYDSQVEINSGGALTDALKNIGPEGLVDARPLIGSPPSPYFTIAPKK